MTELKTTATPAAVNTKSAAKRSKARGDGPTARKPVRVAAEAEANEPPSQRGVPQVRLLAPRGTDLPLGIRMQLHYSELACRNPEVQAALVGRTQLLGCHLLDGVQCDLARQRVRVCFVNYTRNILIEVSFNEGAVERVARRPSQSHPEAPAEMARAIELACSHPALKDQVEGMEARASLQTPPPRPPHSEHRCLRVVFSEQPEPEVERRARYVALVDLNLQQVIHAGNAAS